jgi:tol-pal system protein YbgF
MTRIRSSLFFTLVILALAHPALAQNRVELQLFADLRMLHEVTQKLQLSVNALAEQIKATNARIDAQAEETRKGFANENIAIGEIRNSVRTLGERQNDSSVNVQRLTQEMKAIRDGLTMQNSMLNNIMNLLQTPPDPNAVTDAAAGATPPATPPPGGGGIPPSPSTYYTAAAGYYASTKYEEAIQMGQEALKRFPDSPDAPRALMIVGDSNYQLGRFKEALEAFTAVTTKYKDSDQLPDAYYKQGLAYQQLNQRAQARTAYQYVIKTYPDSVARTLAEQALKKLGGAPDEL